MGTHDHVFANAKLYMVKPVWRISGSDGGREKLEKEVMSYAYMLKGCPPESESGAAAAVLCEILNPTRVDAFMAFEVEWSPADNKAILFERIIRNLPPDELLFVACALEAEYCRKRFGIEVKYERDAIASGEGVKGINDSFLMSYGVPVIVGALAKTLGDKFSTTLGQSSWAKPYEDAATGAGVVLICSAMILKDMKPRVSKIMAKAGVKAIAFATLAPLALALPPVAGLIFGLLMASIVVATLAQI